MLHKADLLIALIILFEAITNNNVRNHTYRYNNQTKFGTENYNSIELSNLEEDLTARRIKQSAYRSICLFKF